MQCLHTTSNSTPRGSKKTLPFVKTRRAFIQFYLHTAHSQKYCPSCLRSKRQDLYSGYAQPELALNWRSKPDTGRIQTLEIRGALSASCCSWCSCFIGDTSRGQSRTVADRAPKDRRHVAQECPCHTSMNRTGGMELIKHAVPAKLEIPERQYLSHFCFSVMQTNSQRPQKTQKQGLNAGMTADAFADL